MSRWRSEEFGGPFKGPVAGLAWDGGRLLVGLPREGRVVALDPETGASSEFRRYTGRTTALTLAADGRLYGCQPSGRRVVCFQTDGSTTLPAEQLDGHLHNHPADLTADLSGRIWFSDAHRGRGAPPGLFPVLPHASVLALERDPSRLWRLRRATRDTRAPGPIQISADGSRLYLAENPEGLEATRELRAYPVAKDGSLGPYRLLLAFGHDHRGPHGGVTALTLAASGELVACVSGPPQAEAAIWVLSADGLPLESCPAPAGIASSSFGGEEGAELYLGTQDGRVLRIRDSGLRGWLPFRAATEAVVGRPLA